MQRIQEKPVAEAGQVQTVRGIVRVEPGDMLVMDTASDECLTVIPHEVHAIARAAASDAEPSPAALAETGSELTSLDSDPEPIA